jgi:hypothetical protein
MSDYIVKDTELTSVANAIRTKGGTNSQLVFPGGFVSAIGNISGGGGSSDFSTAEVTLVGNSIYMSLPVVTHDPQSPMGYFLYAQGDSQLLNPNTYTVALYKGYLLTRLTSDSVISVSLSGGCEWVSEENKTLLITGDCTITIS